MHLLSSSFWSPTNLGSKLKIWLDPSDLSTMWKERTGASATTPAVVDDVVGTILSKDGSGTLYFTAPSDSARGILRNSGGLWWIELDGVDDEYEATVSGLSATSFLCVGLNPGADAEYIVWGHDGDPSRFIVLADDGVGGGNVSSGAGGPTYRVDGVDQSWAGRDDAHDALTGAARVLTVENTGLGSWTALDLGGYSDPGFDFGGNFNGQVVADALTTAERAQVEAYMAGKAGVTL